MEENSTASLVLFPDPTAGEIPNSIESGRTGVYVAEGIWRRKRAEKNVVYLYVQYSELISLIALIMPMPIASSEPALTFYSRREGESEDVPATGHRPFRRVARDRRGTCARGNESIFS